MIKENIEFLRRKKFLNYDLTSYSGMWKQDEKWK